MSEKMTSNLLRGFGKPRLLFMLILSMILLAQPAWACKKQLTCKGESDEVDVNGDCKSKET